MRRFRVSLSEDDIEFLIRSIDLAYTFAISHQGLINQNWRTLDVDMDKLKEKLNKKLRR